MFPSHDLVEEDKNDITEVLYPADSCYPTASFYGCPEVDDKNFKKDLTFHDVSEAYPHILTPDMKSSLDKVNLSEAIKTRIANLVSLAGECQASFSIEKRYFIPQVRCYSNYEFAPNIAKCLYDIAIMTNSPKKIIVNILLNMINARCPCFDEAFFNSVVLRDTGFAKQVKVRCLSSGLLSHALPFKCHVEMAALGAISVARKKHRLGLDVDNYLTKSLKVYSLCNEFGAPLSIKYFTAPEQYPIGDHLKQNEVSDDTYAEIINIANGRTCLSYGSGLGGDKIEGLEQNCVYVHNTALRRAFLSTHKFQIPKGVSCPYLDATRS